MKKKRFTEAQIIAVLKEAEASETARDVCRQHNISEQTFYRWKQKYGGMEISEAKRLKSLEQENERLKRMVADLSLDKQMLEEIVGKKW
jgi:putative transposase